ncbi:MAG: PorT family protein [Bacteroidales bacterium]|nr:PorT family protein [Bacteroidales bacterium]
MKHEFLKPGLLLTLFLALSAVPILAQEEGSCAETLKNAQTLFARGQVEKIPDVLRNCMRSGFKREEQISAYRILIQSYLLEDRLAEADSTMLAFLVKFPEYQLSETDHPDFVSLYRSFRVKPLLQIAFHFGTNIPFLTFVEDQSNSPEPESNSYRSETLNLITSVEVKIPLNDKIDANAEARYLQSRFTNTEKYLGFETAYRETVQRLEIPLSATYSFARFGKNLSAFARAGAGPAFNLKTTATPVNTGLDDNNRNLVSGADLDVTASRISVDLFFTAGAGIRYKTPLGFITLEARSVFGTRNQVIRTGTSESRELAYRYSYCDDDFTMNNLGITLGYTQIFYKPAKRKQGE